MERERERERERREEQKGGKERAQDHAPETARVYFRGGASSTRGEGGRGGAYSASSDRSLASALVTCRTRADPMSAASGESECGDAATAPSEATDMQSEIERMSNMRTYRHTEYSHPTVPRSDKQHTNTQNIHTSNNR